MIRIKAEIIEEMKGHALMELPNECCGLLSGSEELIDGIRRCSNERSSPTQFSVPPAELFKFFRSLRTQRRDFLGIYHSHPDGKPTPSKRDEEEFHYPDTSYWIVSLNNGRASVRCFAWVEAGFAEVPFKVLKR
jgi:proteasome lid subunit RPN8/RPN11